MLASLSSFIVVVARSGTRTAIEHVEVDLQWNLRELATFWILQPIAQGLSASAPCSHREGPPGSPLQLLEAALAQDRQLNPPGPVFFVLPELSVDAEALGQLRSLVRTLPAGRAVIAGLGHLTQQQCDSMEAGVGGDPQLWRTTWAIDRYANAAAICVGSQIWLEAKDWPSPFEEQANCHQPHARVRIFRGKGFSFAVLICSEVLPKRLSRPE